MILRIWKSIINYIELSVNLFLRLPCSNYRSHSEWIKSDDKHALQHGIDDTIRYRDTARLNASACVKCKFTQHKCRIN